MVDSRTDRMMDKLRFMQQSQQHAARTEKRAVFEAMQSAGLEDAAHTHGALCKALGTRAGGGYCGGVSFGRDAGLREIAEE